MQKKGMKRLAIREEVREGKVQRVNPGGKRLPAEQEADRHWMVAEVARGRTYQEIADELNSKRAYHLSKEQVRLDVQSAIVEWKRENMENIDAVIGKELARLEMLEARVLEDYEKSKNLRAVDYACMLKRGFTIEEIDAMFEGKMPGNPQFMETLLHIQMSKLKILGIDKGNDVPTNTIVQYNFGSLNEAQLASMADRLQDAKAAEMVREMTVEEQ